MLLPIRESEIEKERDGEEIAEHRNKRLHKTSTVLYILLYWIDTLCRRNLESFQILLHPMLLIFPHFVCVFFNLLCVLAY